MNKALYVITLYSPSFVGLGMKNTNGFKYRVMFSIFSFGSDDDLSGHKQWRQRK